MIPDVVYEAMMQHTDATLFEHLYHLQSLCTLFLISQMFLITQELFI